MLSPNSVIELQNAFKDATLGDLTLQVLTPLRDYVFELLKSPRYVNLLFEEHTKHSAGPGRWCGNDEQRKQMQQKEFKDVEIFDSLFRMDGEQPVAGVAIWHARINLWESSLNKRNVHGSARLQGPPIATVEPVRLTVALFRLMQTRDSLIFILPEFHNAVRTFQQLTKAYSADPSANSMQLEHAILNLKVRIELYILYLDDLKKHLNTISHMHTLTREVRDALTLIDQERATVTRLMPSFTSALINSKLSFIKALLLWLFPQAFPHLKPRDENQDWFSAIKDYLNMLKEVQQQMHTTTETLLTEQLYEFLRRIADDVSRLQVPDCKSSQVLELIEQAKTLAYEKESEKIANDLIRIIDEGYFNRAGLMLTSYLSELEKGSPAYQYLISKFFIHLDKHVFGTNNPDIELPSQQERAFYINLMRRFFDDWNSPNKCHLQFYQKVILPSYSASATLEEENVEVEEDDEYAGISRYSAFRN